MFKKIIPIFGDITNFRLGLSDEHYQRVISSTNIVFHMAASLKLEATLKPNVEMNLIGTKHVIDVCKKMPKLLSVIHMSTAFCNCDQEELKEEVYDWPQVPMDLIRCAEWMTEEAMDIMGRKLIAPHPNTVLSEIIFITLLLNLSNFSHSTPTLRDWQRYWSEKNIRICQFASFGHQLVRDS